MIFFNSWVTWYYAYSPFKHDFYFTIHELLNYLQSFKHDFLVYNTWTYLQSFKHDFLAYNTWTT